ncbi:hypothetical protein KIW84_061862 [Lathyrus oleraceus]|uniref:Uncharacterized protein n=1 Tax=Pisum sativum TaxID=3888 RepID=A0A9D4W4X4_PEA|nr:hypothetical protein KIW84_061862 [Pisum sativum]
MRYLKKNVNLGLHYQRFSGVLEEYNDADWNTLSDDSKATSDYVFNIARGTTYKDSKDHFMMSGCKVADGSGTILLSQTSWNLIGNFVD